MTLQTQNLSIGYGKNIVQKNLNLSVGEGRLICLIGRNGCGKSTLLRTLAGLQPALCGQVLIDGKNITKLSDYKRSTLLSLVLTDKIEVENLCISDLAALGRYPYTSWNGNLSENDKKIVQNALKQVNLLHLKNKNLSEVSDGEKQRAVIAKALAQDTPLVLLDEPTSHLDLANRIEIMMLLRRLSVKTKKTFILSTHELDLALKMADFIWLMNENGTTTGIPEDLLLSGIFQQSFENQHFNFDTEDGHYRIFQPTGNLKIAVTGENERAKWLKRAFVRCGIIEDKNAEIKIETADNQYIINGRKVSSIEKVLEIL
ncbi:MAG: ABC transporter ATP-binding protein [Prevotellaceae bacterium]|jgi:iron complex transport system ATP-binding protein|nr:ABC transporter ATP-binding protein [Prevotellaceae bacterium]